MTDTPRSVHGGLSTALVVFGIAIALVFTIQAFNSQRLIEHPIWADMLEALSADYAERITQGQHPALPMPGVISAWHVARDQPVPAGTPGFLIGQSAGYYSSEGGAVDLDTDMRFHAQVSDLPDGQLIVLIDIRDLEDQQNRDSLMVGIAGVLLLALVCGAIVWLRANLVQPVRDLADRMRAMDPEATGVRLPTTYRQEEIQTIAQASNAHLDRVQRFIERERSLLDQASHEFRTPIAVIAGAVDLLRQMPLPASSQPVLGRIEHAVETLTETMVALLYLAREPGAVDVLGDVTALHLLLPELVRDHEHLLQGKPITLRIGPLPGTFIAAPDAMVRIAVGNLLRNAIENSDSGDIEVALVDGVITIADAGAGFDPAEAARRYRDALRHAAPVRGRGLGLFLIGRICERFGWTLRIEPAGAAGTRATLDVSASRFSPDQDDAFDAGVPRDDIPVT